MRLGGKTPLAVLGVRPKWFISVSASTFSPVISIIMGTKQSGPMSDNGSQDKRISEGPFFLWMVFEVVKFEVPSAML